LLALVWILLPFPLLNTCERTNKKEGEGRRREGGGGGPNKKKSELLQASRTTTTTTTDGVMTSPTSQRSLGSG
jgi:hypothetical protein